MSSGFHSYRVNKVMLCSGFQVQTLWKHMDDQDVFSWCLFRSDDDDALNLTEFVQRGQCSLTLYSSLIEILSPISSWNRLRPRDPSEDKSGSENE